MKKKMFTMLILAAFAGFLYAQDWRAAGSHPGDYEMSGDPTVAHGGDNGANISSISDKIEGFGTWMTSVSAKDYLNKGIRLSAYLKSENIESSAGIWLRVDGADGKILSFDNMDSRPVRGTTDWNLYEILLDVPLGSSEISFGILLSGTGSVWADGLKIEPARRTWLFQEAGITNYVLSIRSVNESVVWAGTTFGKYLRTLDGGSTWTSGSVPGAGSVHFYTIAAIDSEIAYFSGYDMELNETRIYKTLDGGNNWMLQYQNGETGAFINSIAFWNDSAGLAVSDAVDSSFIILRTVDGGENWDQVDTENIPAPLTGEFAGFADGGGTSLSMAGDKYAWFGTAYDVESDDPIRVFRSSDQGLSWEVSETNLTSSGVYHGITSMTFIDSLSGFAGSSNYPWEETVGTPRTTLVKTTDGGKTWESVNSFPSVDVGTLAIIPDSDPQMIFTTSIQGSLISVDGGLTWERLNHQYLLALDFASPGAGWAAGGPEGKILKFAGYNNTVGLDQYLFQSKGILHLQNHPNPFSQHTLITYELAHPGEVLLDIVDIAGKRIETLVSGYQLPGKYQLEWKPADLQAGIYLCRIVSGVHSGVTKLIYKK